MEETRSGHDGCFPSAGSMPYSAKTKGDWKLNIGHRGISVAWYGETQLGMGRDLRSFLTSYWESWTVVLEHEPRPEFLSCHRLARGSLGSHCPCDWCCGYGIWSSEAGGTHSTYGDRVGGGWDPRAGQDMECWVKEQTTALEQQYK